MAGQAFHAGDYTLHGMRATRGLATSPTLAKAGTSYWAMRLLPMRIISLSRRLREKGVNMLGGCIIAFGLFLMISGGTPAARILGIVIAIVGGVVFWKNSATRNYLDR